jgi:Glyoxalase/Bleomycin resistance protein/Dioxygenase superfamily
MKPCTIVAVLLGVVILLGAIAAGQQAAPANDPGMRKVTQVAILTRDVQASARRWADVLGVAPGPMRLTRPGGEVKLLYHGKPSAGQARIINIRLEGLTLELIEPVGADTSWKEILDQKGEIVHHIAFSIQDVPGTVKHFEDLGYPVAHQGLFDGLNGSYTYMDTAKSLGVTIELLHTDATAAKR